MAILLKVTLFFILFIYLFIGIYLILGTVLLHYCYTLNIYISLQGRFPWWLRW